MKSVDGVIVETGNEKSGLLPYSFEIAVESDLHRTGTAHRIAHEKKGAFLLNNSAFESQLTIGKYEPELWGSGPDVHVMTFYHDLDECVIVYGTLADENTNKETATLLQETIRKHGSNITVPIVADSELKAEHVKGHHLLLIGSPSANRLAKNCEKLFPITFRTGSFTVDRETYAHDGSAAIAAAVHPGDTRYSIVLFAGLSSEATYHTPTFLLQKGLHPGQVLVIPHGTKARNVVLPPKRLQVDLSEVPVEKK